MSADLGPEAAIARVPDFAGLSVDIERSLDGLTNRSWQLRAGDDRYVLRLDASHTSDLPIDREAELAAHALAAEAGLAPPIVHADPAAGILVTRFQPGPRLTDRSLREPSVLANLAALLHEVHALERTGCSFDALAAGEAYRRKIAADPALDAVAAACLRIIEATGSDSAPRCCHNDVIAENLIANPDDGALLLLDWEYAADNDPYFDLAMPLAYHELDRSCADVLLSAYAGTVTAARRERLQQQLRRCDALHWLWLACRQSTSPDRSLARRLERLRDRIVA